jgi:hypothetical protein
MRVVFYICAAIAVLLTLVAAGSDSAPKQAAAAAIALCFVVIPYTVLRVRQLAKWEQLEAERHKALIADIRDMADRVVEAGKNSSASSGA